MLGVRAPGCGRVVLKSLLGAVGDSWIVLGRLLGCATAGGSWRWFAHASGPPGSTGLGSGVRPPRRGWPSSPSVCKGAGGGGGGQKHSVEDPGGGGGGGIGGPWGLNRCATLASSAATLDSKFERTSMQANRKAE